jgi:ABC-2 type transport system ATP-binding protein
LQDANRVEVRASGIQLTDQLRADLEAVLQRHGGKLDSVGHPTTTLEDYFLQIVEQSKAHPGRRFLPGKDGGRPGAAAPAAAPGLTKVKDSQ